MATKKKTPEEPTTNPESSGAHVLPELPDDELWKRFAVSNEEPQPTQYTFRLTNHTNG